MNAFLIAIILGIIEGITEFLPISSTGHLILINEFVNFTGNFAHTFDVVIQFGAILSVVVYFWNKLYPFSAKKSDLERNMTWDIWKKTLIALIPAVILGGTVGKLMQEKLFNPYVVGMMLFLGGIVLILIENKQKKARIDSIAALSYKTAFLIGMIQCLGMIPGTSRSAATIIGAMLLGVSRLAAAEFSFFLAIPTMAAASAYSLYKTGLGMTMTELLVLLTGVVVSFLVALLVISVFMNYISKKDFKAFGYYRIVLGAIVLVYFILWT